MKELVETPEKNSKSEISFDIFDLIEDRRKAMAVKKVLESAKHDQKLTVPLSRLPCKIIGGGWNHMNNIGVAYHFFQVEVGDLVLETWNDIEKVFEVQGFEKANVNIICTSLRIKRNEILLEFDRRIASGEIPENSFAPDGAAIDLIIDVKNQTF